MFVQNYVKKENCVKRERELFAANTAGNTKNSSNSHTNTDSNNTTTNSLPVQDQCFVVPSVQNGAAPQRMIHYVTLCPAAADVACERDCAHVRHACDISSVAFWGTYHAHLHACAFMIALGRPA